MNQPGCGTTGTPGARGVEGMNQPGCGTGGKPGGCGIAGMNQPGLGTGGAADAIDANASAAKTAAHATRRFRI